jgi:hypothetical protein
MKMLSNKSDDERPSFPRFVLPVGRRFPHAPLPGEIFHLEYDMPVTNTATPWFGRGTYTFDGLNWNKLNDGGRQRRAVPIGAVELDLTDPDRKPDRFDDPPTVKGGTELVTVDIQPSTIKSTFSGSGSLWVDVAKSAHVWATIFRDGELVSTSAVWVNARQPATLALSFFDVPGATEPLLYSLRLYSDKAERIFVNQCHSFTFDGTSQTALIVAENT